jgi:acetyltransferase-like isoleucine patch superfamily enzyme
MFKNMFFLNPVRKQSIASASFKQRLIFSLRQKIINVGTYFGFMNIDYTYVHGNKKRVLIGENCSTMNSILNVISGSIHIGDNTILGHNCMLLTGTHNFKNGKRISLLDNHDEEETPKTGRDIIIGEGCFIGSGVSIIGPVTIGNNVIIASGSVVNKNINDYSLVGGIPAKLIKKLI